MFQIEPTPNLKLVFVGMESGFIGAYDAQSGELVHVLEGHADRITGMALSGDETLLTSISDDRTVGFWDLPNVCEDIDRVVFF